MSNRSLLNLIPILVFFVGCATQRQTASVTDPSVPNLRTHIEYLASDKLEGRRTGTEGEKLAAAYISNAFQTIGLLPKGTNGFYQAFPVNEGKEIAPSTAFSINDKPLILNSDFFPLVFSANGRINATPSIALMEKGEPWFFNLRDVLTENKANPHFDLTEAVIARAKDAAKKGATALLLYNTSVTADGWNFDGKDKTDVLPIPVVFF